jgi:uncharacterized protein
MNLWLLFSLVITGSFISSLTGLGGGTLILAGLLVVYPPELAIPLHSFTQFSANALRSGLFFKTVNWKVVGLYSLLMLPSAWLGAKIFDYLNTSWLKIFVSIFILISISPIKLKVSGEPRPRTFILLGALSGFLGIFVGAVGPMVMPFFNRLKIPRESMIATKSAGQALLQTSKIIAFTGAAGFDLFQLQSHIGLLILATLIGVGISIPVSRKITDDKFNLALNIMLTLVALKVLYEGIADLLTA